MREVYASSKDHIFKANVVLVHYFTATHPHPLAMNAPGNIHPQKVLLQSEPLPYFYGHLLWLHMIDCWRLYALSAAKSNTLKYIS